MTTTVGFRQLAVCLGLVLATIGGMVLSAPATWAQATGVIQQVRVVGNERIEAATVQSYMTLRAGDTYTAERADDTLKSLFATGLFSDVAIQFEGGILNVVLSENPIINRILFEGNKKLDNEELTAELQLRPRVVYTRAKVRADVDRILELYRRSGRFAAVVEPKIVQLAQNRVNLIYEISEGPKTKIRRINFIGNERYSDGDLRDALVSVESRWWKIFTSFDTFDPDRFAYDADQLRQFYFNEGYADFRVVSAIAELAPDRENFILTLTVEEGEIYEFGEVEVESQIRDIDPEVFKGFLSVRSGRTYSSEGIENSVDNLTNAAGILGYAFVDIRPRIDRDRANRKINVTFRILEAPRVYVERINIRGNVRTIDEVVRREFRLLEGDAFNLSLMERSKQRLNQLGFFREVEIEQLQGSRPDRVVLDVSVQEEATGELSLGAAFSSLENFIFQFDLRERNFLGKGQDFRFGLALSGRRQQIDLGFTEPYFLGRNIGAGFDLFATDFERPENGFDTQTLGGSLRLGLPLAEYTALRLNYTLRNDDVTLNTRFFDIGEALEDNPFFRDSLGSRLTSSIGYSVIYDSVNNRLRPTAGQRLIVGQDLAGLGGNVRFLKTRLDYDSYYSFNALFGRWTLRLAAEGAYAIGLGQNIRINDRFFLGGPRIRGYENLSVGPAEATVRETQLTEESGNTDANGNPILVPVVDENGDPVYGPPQVTTQRNRYLGGNAYYLGTVELFLPLGSAADELGVQASIFTDIGAVWEIDDEIEPTVQVGQVGGLFERISNNVLLGDTPKPRISVGIGVSWQSPFGPFRIDLAKSLQEEPSDDTQTLQFNIGTRF